MTFFAGLLLIAAAYVLIFNYTVLSKNTRSKVNQSFAVFGFSIFVWLVSFGVAYFINDLEIKLAWYKFGYLGIIFIPTNFYLFTCFFVGKRKKFLAKVGFGCALLLCTMHFSAYSLIDGLYVYSWHSYPRAALPQHPLLLLYFLIFFSLSFYELVKMYFREHSSIQRAKVSYIIIGACLGTMGSVDYLPNYGINVIPFGFIFMVLYPSILTYAIIRYRLMDVTLAITRTSIFVTVYTFVLGIPFALAFGIQDSLIRVFDSNWWIIPLTSSTILATIGPYVYITIQRKAEDKLLQEQRQYQATLRQASLGMGQIKDLNRLLNLIVHVVTRAVKIENCKIFLRHEDSKQYIQKAVKGNKGEDGGTNKLSFESPLVHYFNQMKEPLVYEEVKQRRSDVGGEGLEELEQILEDMDSALVVPSFIEQKLIAIISLGKKRSGKLYSYDDLAVFAILANQSALAIENAQFYEDMKRTHVQLLKAEKMATVGTMADGLSHQINNRLHAMGFIAGDLLDTVRLGLKNGVSKKNRELLTEIESGLERIQQNVKHGGEIVGGLLRYTRKGEQGFGAVNFQELLKSAFEMAQFKIKINMMEVHRHFDDTIPQIKGNFTQLQEVFFNLIDNSYDAMMQRKDELGEEGFKPRLDIFAREVGAKIEIIMQDNGMGVKETDMHKLFAPFFTTKATSKKGTGLGLYVIRQIIEDNHGGKVNFSSKYKIGSETHIILPIAVQKVK
ncbi:MAG: GAF domain-containing protein [Candidatus Omnitrophica bacterium]|nr:GAF domain-containing protein [Candidatus Omnitrophota bacterium]